MEKKFVLIVFSGNNNSIIIISSFSFRALEEWGSWKALEQELMKRKQEADEAESSEAKKYVFIKFMLNTAFPFHARRGCSYKKAPQISHTARLEHEQEVSFPCLLLLC